MTTSLEKTFKGASVLVTGHTGFKGAWLAYWLSKLGARVSGFSLDPEAEQETLFRIVEEAGTFGETGDRRGDILDSSAVAEAVVGSKPDYVFHLAAQSLVRRSYEEPLKTFSVNVQGTAHVLEAVRTQAPDAVVVVVTSDKCYENQEWSYAYREIEPLGGKDPYSASKAAAELVVASWRESFFNGGAVPGKISTARGGNVIGGGDFAQDRLFPDLARSISKNETIEVRSPGATRPWQHVLDCLSGYLRLAQWLKEESDSTDSESRAFNFGPRNESERSVADLVEECFRQWRGSWKDVSEGEKPHEATRLAVSIELAQSTLDWKPTWNFGQAVANTVEWYRVWSEDNSSASLREVMDRQIAEFAESR